MTKNDIIKELGNLKNEIRSIEKAIDLMYKVQLSQGPLIEVVTVIKFEKPQLYAFLKTRLQNNPGFKMILDVPVDYELAKKSLGL